MMADLEIRRDIENGYLIRAGQKRVREMRSDETRPTRNQYLQGPPPNPLAATLWKAGSAPTQRPPKFPLPPRTERASPAAPRHWSRRSCPSLFLRPRSCQGSG